MRHEPSPSTPEGLAKRLRDLETGLAEERRIRPPVVTPPEPSDGGKVPLLVAAADAHPATIAAASYVCTGTDDQTTIQQAVDDLFDGDAVVGRILLSEGTFSLSGTVDCYTASTPGFVEFEGMGAQVTYVEQQSGATRNFYAFTGEGLQGLRNLQIKGTQGGVYDLLSNSVVQGCQFWELDVALFAQSTGEVSIAGNLFYDCGIGVQGQTLTDTAVTGNVFAGSTTADISCTTSSNLAVVGNISTGSAAFVVLDAVEVQIGAGNVVDGVLVGEHPTVESDSDGQRIPIKDNTGTVVGYLGYSAEAGNGLALWYGDTVDVGASAQFALYPSGGFYAQTSDNSTYIDLSAVSGNAQIRATANIRLRPGALLRFFSATGIDGTATPSTVAELADVLVDLGIIASHTIT